MSTRSNFASPLPSLLRLSYRLGLDESEPPHVTGLKLLLYAVALVLYMLPLAGVSAMLFAILSAGLAVIAADRASKTHLRPFSAVATSVALVFFAFALARTMRDASWLTAVLGIAGALIVSDVVAFSLATFGTLFILRYLANRARIFSVLEVFFVAGSVVTTFAAHRNRMLSRPRFLSDWAWSLGIDPATVLVAIGAIATVLSVFLFLRRQTLLKLVLSAIALLFLTLTFYFVADKRMDPSKETDVLGLSGKPKEGEGKGDGKSENDDPFKNDYSPNTPPEPVAIAILRDDLDDERGILYFRQRTQSRFNGHHLVADDTYDQDVIVEMPTLGTAEAEPTQAEAHHTQFPSTMYLLVDHPQPPALSHAVSLTPVANPNPNQFVAAYDVVSFLLSVDPLRLLGRKSIPDDWSAERIKHYTTLPDDPRYRALADIITRQIDPRFASDDLMKAFAIKRYLEREGFYTRRSTHADAQDPTAAFLFGSKRGYCVHFAHAAVYLFRSVGIAARVALGYAVMTGKRAGGSSVLIMGDRAHAWPEIFIDGVGWVTFDVYPEHTDLPPPSPVDYDLEKLLGELARADKTGGVSPDGQALTVPWVVIARGTLILFAVLLMLAYFIKVQRRLQPVFSRGDRKAQLTYRRILDHLAGLGLPRHRGESRERHAARLRDLSPALEPLTAAHLALALGSQGKRLKPESIAELAQQVERDLSRSISPAKRFLGFLNPIGWLWTR